MNWLNNLRTLFSPRPASLSRGALLVAACLLALGTVSVEAKTKKTKKDASPTPAESPSSKTTDKTLDIPIPIDHEAKGVRIPVYTPEGKLQMLFESEIAFRVDAQQLRLTQLKIETYDEEGKPEMSIDMPQSMFNLKSRILSSNDPVTIRRTDFEVTGSHMVFDTQTRQGKFNGPVRMLVYNVNNAAEKPQESAPGE
ncbi:MAG: LPS export ABC transporter periplasmic protein LptC [Verrucomicrobiota bacterium]